MIPDATFTKTLRLWPAVLLAAMAACGGSDSGAPGVDGASNVPGTDAGPGADAMVTPAPDAMGAPSDDAAAANACAGAQNGKSCGADSVCIAEACVPSRCGDGFVDSAAGEECEDGNAVSGDGCSLCRFDCKSPQDCDDKLTCNGAETCALATHTCAPGTAVANGTACMMANNAAGVCNVGECVQAGCGNKAVDQGEDCDDGNNVETDGCTSKCKFTCAGAMDCDNGNACDGTETCDLASHTCKAGVAVVCNAKAGCNGTCNPQSGMCQYPDADTDGVACNTDCNDADPAMFPGGYECKDGKDNDCKPESADGTAPSCECYVDTDKDTYAVNVDGAIAAAGACPVGYTRKKPVDAKTKDCAGKVAAAYPGQPAYFPTGYCPGDGGLCVPSFDYNCDGAATSTTTENKLASASCVGALNAFACFFRSGWVAAQVPGCGVKGTFRQCTWSEKAGTCTGVDLADVRRSCH